MSQPLAARPGTVPQAPLDGHAIFAAVAGLCASLVAIGLARFAYTPLIPPLIQAHWFTAPQAVTLGAANFAGYLAGAMLGRPLASAVSNRTALRLLMLLASAAFIACAWPLSVTWYFAWRFAAGLAGGAIMVLVATSILPHIPAPRRGFVSGMIFLGLGLGIAASGTLVPRLLQLGLRETWLGLGLVSLALTLLSWFGWPAAAEPASLAASARPAAAAHQDMRRLYGQYALNALGLVPVMLLLVDYIARGLGRGSSVGAGYWVLYGVAAIAGPLLCGLVADRVGFRLAYRGAMLLQGIAVALLAATGDALVIGIVTALLGVFTPGIVPLTLGRIQEMMPHDPIAQRASWSHATTAFALLQALSGYGYSWLFAHTGQNYTLIFACGAVAMALALALDFGGARRQAA